MDFQNFWFSSGANGGGPSPDPGDPIRESLRFRGGNTSLTNTNIDTDSIEQVFTFSCWLKQADSTQNGTQPFRDGNGPNATGNFQINMSGTSIGNGAWTWNLSNGSNGFVPNARYRDPNAWYHIVGRYNGANTLTQIWVNGEPVTQSQGSGTLTSTNIRLDGFIFGANGWQGYIADAYLLETQLTADNFGRYNDSGVWVPDPDAFTSAQYGAAGFHLDFGDPDNIGADVAPTGAGHTAANNFTPNNIDTDPVGIFSNDLSTNTTFSNTNPPVQAFNGNTNDFCLADGVIGVNTTMTFAPSTPILLTSLQVFAPGFTDQTITFGGQTTTLGPASTWVNINIGTATELSTASTMVLTRLTAGESARLPAIRINGTTVLVNNTGIEYDSMQDSPTQNWATGNPLYFESGADPSVITWSKANLAFTSSSTGFWKGWSGQVIEAGDTNTYYVEFSSTAASGGYPAICICEPWANPWGVNGFVWNTQDQTTFYNTVQQANWTGDTYAANDVAGCTYNASTGVVTGFINGNQAGTFTMVTGIDRVIGFGAPPQDIPLVDFNFGQRPFIHQPASTTPLQTDNLPAKTIPNGRDHFQAITGPGQGADVNETGAGDWSPFLTVPGGWKSNRPPSRAFDGNTSASAAAEVVGSVVVTFAPDVDIPFTSSIEVMAGSDSVMTAFADNPAVSTPIGARTEIFSGSGVINADNPITFSYTGSNQVQITAIWVDGNFLLDLNLLAVAQNTFPNGLWWIKDMVNANQHQLVDSVRGQVGGNWQALTCPTPSLNQDYIPPNGDSVAWCWNAGVAATANNDGSRQSEVAANTAAGFSIVEYTANGAAETYGHGLDTDPEFIIFFRTADPGNSPTNTSVYHQALGTSLRLVLNNANPQDGTPYLTAVNETTFSIPAGANLTNKVDNDYIAYCWTSIPGYSAFGSFNGNSSSNGPFIYLGFRPAFVMTKRTDSAANWEIFDSTRSPINPCDTPLYPNQDFDEPNPDPLTDVDFLSNGFKLRNGQSNSNQGTLIYCAFAENPFGGSNVSPANAR